MSMKHGREAARTQGLSGPSPLWTAVGQRIRSQL